MFRTIKIAFFCSKGKYDSGIIKARIKTNKQLTEEMILSVASEVIPDDFSLDSYQTEDSRPSIAKMAFWNEAPIFKIDK